MSRLVEAIPTSGQKRINAKRNNRARFWAEFQRTVRLPCSPEIEPHLREHLHLFGLGSRIDGRREVNHGFGPVVELSVHVPGMPAEAVRAAPIFYSDWDGVGQAKVRLESVEWYDANGRLIADG